MVIICVIIFWHLFCAKYQKQIVFNFFDIYHISFFGLMKKRPIFSNRSWEGGLKDLRQKSLSTIFLSNFGLRTGDELSLRSAATVRYR